MTKQADFTPNHIKHKPGLSMTEAFHACLVYLRVQNVVFVI